MSKFWSHYERVKELILACRNYRYVNESEKKALRNDTAALERNHLKYLLETDPEQLWIRQEVRARRDIEIFQHSFHYAFGLF